MKRKDEVREHNETGFVLGRVGGINGLTLRSDNGRHYFLFFFHYYPLFFSFLITHYYFDV